MNKESKDGLNTIAVILKVFAMIGVSIAVVAGLSSGSWESCITIIIVSVILAILIYALGEIIQLLEDIKNK